MTANRGADREVPLPTVTALPTTTPMPCPYMATSGCALLVGSKYLGVGNGTADCR